MLGKPVGHRTSSIPRSCRTRSGLGVMGDANCMLHPRPYGLGADAHASWCRTSASWASCWSCRSPAVILGSARSCCTLLLPRDARGDPLHQGRAASYVDRQRQDFGPKIGADRRPSPADSDYIRDRRGGRSSRRDTDAIASYLAISDRRRHQPAGRSRIRRSSWCCCSPYGNLARRAPKGRRRAFAGAALRLHPAASGSRCWLGFGSVWPPGT